MSIIVNKKDLQEAIRVKVSNEAELNAIKGKVLVIDDAKKQEFAYEYAYELQYDSTNKFLYQVIEKLQQDINELTTELHNTRELLAQYQSATNLSIIALSEEVDKNKVF